jgi:hypothetical protein
MCAVYLPGSESEKLADDGLAEERVQRLWTFNGPLVLEGQALLDFDSARMVRAVSTQIGASVSGGVVSRSSRRCWLAAPEQPSLAAHPLLKLDCPIQSDSGV